jgi:hypothetical protein
VVTCKNSVYPGHGFYLGSGTVGMFFSGRDWETSQDRGKMNGAKYREILDEHSGPQTGAKVHLPTGQQP